MDVKDFYYDLPQELMTTQDPLEDRSELQIDGVRQSHRRGGTQTF